MVGPIIIGLSRLELDAIIAKLRQDLDLSGGYVVELDPHTDNVIIKGAKLGFCVTSHFLRENGYDGSLAGIMGMLRTLKRKHRSSGVIKPIAELYPERKQA